MFLLTAVLCLSSCETFDLDQLNNPSTLDNNQSDPIYVFNYVQLTLPDFVYSANTFTQRITRQMAMTGGNTYNNAFAPVNSDNNWTTGYLMLNAIKSMEPKAIENNYTFVLGASKIMRCYILMTMADVYGDIPYSEALQGNANLTPRYDNSADVYAGVYNELNEAIGILADADPTNGAPRDLYYGNDKGVGNAANWITLANTLKLKMLNNSRQLTTLGSYNITNEITTLIGNNDLIDTPAEDFAFKYGTTRVNPNSRHPLYNDQYELGGGQYIANYFMWAVSREKNRGQDFDPRERFYFFKQAPVVGSSTNAANLPCKSLAKPTHYEDSRYASFYAPATIKATYCTSDNLTFTNAYLGRDHGDNSGIPSDDDIRTVAGIYPIGGEIGSPINVNSNTNFGLTGELGRGIMPMILSSYVHFIKAEIKLTLNIGGVSAEDELKAGILASIDKTTTFIPMPSDAAPFLPTATKIQAYVDFVLGVYNGDGNTDAKRLELIIKEYYIAAWGNGIEPYNAYRRTGYPSNFQPTLEENAGEFYNTAYYAGASVNNNPNAPSNNRSKKVFWDVANLPLH